MTNRCHTPLITFSSERNQTPNAPKKAPSTVRPPLRISSLRRSRFHIDVSRGQPFIVLASLSRELPLATLTPDQLDRVRQIAVAQLRRGVIHDDDEVDAYRATVYYLDGWDRRRQPPLGPTAEGRDRQSRSGRHAGATRPATAPAA